MMLDFDIRFYIRVVRKWLWLVLLVGALVGAAAYYVLSLRSDEYQARTLIAVGTFLLNPDPGLEELRLAQELTPTYAQVVETRRVLEPVIEVLGLDAGVPALQRAIETESIPETSLFVITVTWSDPITAAAIANEVANQLIISNPSNLSPALQNQVDLSQAQIDLLTTQIDDLQSQLVTLDERIARAETEAEEAEATAIAAEEAAEEAAAAAGDAAPESEIEVIIIEQAETDENGIPIQNEPAPDARAAAIAEAEAAADDAAAAADTAQARLDGLLNQRSDTIGQINQATATIAQLSANITQIQQRTNALVIQQEATPPLGPVGTNTLMLTLIAAAGSAVALGGALLLLEATDTSFRSERRIEFVLEVPVRGTVALGSRRQIARVGLAPTLQEPYQMLRTNLMYGEVRAQTPAYIFSSPTATERRSLVLVNLALAAADSGSRVLLLDADLRKPDLSDILQLSNEHGLVEFLATPPASLDDAEHVAALRDSIVQREVREFLDVIPSGTSAENPIRLLESPAMKRLMLLLMHDQYDFIIINTPPVLTYPDASALAALTGIEVLLLLEHARSRSEDAVAALDQVKQIGGTVNGVVYVR